MGSIEDRVAALEGKVRGLLAHELRIESVRPCGTFGLVPLFARLTSTDWDGDAHSTTAKTLIDLSAVFGVPDFIKAVLFFVAVRDSGSDATSCYIWLSPNDTAGDGLGINCSETAQRWHTECLIVPCNEDGDVYWQGVASDVDTLDVTLEVWGYFL